MNVKMKKEREREREREKIKTDLVISTSIRDDLNHYPNVEQLCNISLVM